MSIGFLLFYLPDEYCQKVEYLISLTTIAVHGLALALLIINMDSSLSMTIAQYLQKVF